MSETAAPKIAFGAYIWGLILLAGATGAQPETLPPKLDAILFYGQSNAGAGGPARPLLTAPSPGVFTFSSARQVYGAHTIDPSRLSGLGPLSDYPAYAPFPATAMGVALDGMRRDDKSGRAYFLHTVWYGSQAISAFRRGASSWEDLMIVARRLREVGGAEARVSALVFLQGESGPSNFETFRSNLAALLDETLPALQRETGQTTGVTALLAQTNVGSKPDGSENDSDLAQAAVAAARPDEATLAGPMYQLPLADNIHETAEGRMMLGEMLARAYLQRVAKGEPFSPLAPIEAKLRGRDITVKFRRPEGDGPLRFDTAWVAPAPDFGFAVKNQGRAAAISSVAIAGPDTVVVTLAGDASGPLQLRYAQDQSFAPGWSSARGQLISETTIPSVFHEKGYKVPKTLVDYCVRFVVDVQTMR